MRSDAWLDPGDVMLRGTGHPVSCRRVPARVECGTRHPGPQHDTPRGGRETGRTSGA